jgi:hypothetical protein
MNRATRHERGLAPLDQEPWWPALGLVERRAGLAQPRLAPAPVEAISILARSPALAGRALALMLTFLSIFAMSSALRIRGAGVNLRAMSCSWNHALPHQWGSGRGPAQRAKSGASTLEIRRMTVNSIAQRSAVCAPVSLRAVPCC